MSRHRAARSRESAIVTGRLEGRIAVMRAFDARPGEALDLGQLAAATRLRTSAIKGACAALVEDGWLEPTRVADVHDRYGWQRPTATATPDGWIRVQLYDAAQQSHDGRAFLTVALLCSLPCLRAWATNTTKVSV